MTTAGVVGWVFYLWTNKCYPSQLPDSKNSRGAGKYVAAHEMMAELSVSVINNDESMKREGQKAEVQSNSLKDHKVIPNQISELHVFGSELLSQKL